MVHPRVVRQESLQGEWSHEGSHEVRKLARFNDLILRKSLSISFKSNFHNQRIRRQSGRRHTTVCITDLFKLNLVKIRNGGLVLCSSQFPVLPQLPQKMTLAAKVVKIIISLR